MASRPYLSFAEIKQNVSIPEVLRELGIADQFTGDTGTLSGVCPLPGHQHGPQPNPQQFKINQKQGVWLWHCFGDCQRGGDVIELVKAITGLDNAHVRFWFAEHFGHCLTLEQPRRRDRQRPQTSQAPETSAAPVPEKTPAPPPEVIPSRDPPSADTSTKTPQSPPPLKPLRFYLHLDPDVPYLAERGLTPETIRRFGLGLCKKGLLAGYVAIPVYAYPRPVGSNPIGYLGRWPGEPVLKNGEESEHPRYKFPPEFPRNRIIYGLAEALEGTEGRPLIVVEGPFKVFHLFQAGYPQTVATFGAAVSDEQVTILAATGRPLVLLFDGDEAGQVGMRSAAERLMARAAVRVIHLPASQHPDHLSATELAQVLA